MTKEKLNMEEARFENNNGQNLPQQVFCTGKKRRKNAIMFLVVWLTIIGFFTETAKGQADVYVVGSQKNEHGIKVAMLWKNGIAFSLTNGSKNAIAYSVYVSYNDVYIAGYEENAKGIKVAKLWKNSVAYNLTDGGKNGVANSVYVYKNDVYVAGVDDGATLWKNGISQKLGTLEAKSVYVSDNNVYVVGGQPKSYFSILWKNGIEKKITNQFDFVMANSVFVSDKKVFIAGSEGNDREKVAILWKNGEKYSFSNSVISSALSVYVSNNDVYIAGYRYNNHGIQVAALLLNGTEQCFTRTKNHSSANSVFVSGSDVYVVGYEMEYEVSRDYKEKRKRYIVTSNYIYKNGVATLWKNGVLQNLTDGKYDAVAYSVFVSEGYTEIDDEKMNEQQNIRNSRIDYPDGSYTIIVYTIEYSDGSYYIGEFKDDKFHGNGKYFFAGGDHYDGEWKDDEKHGKGKYYFDNGDFYDGEWKNGVRHGNGTLFFNNGNRWEGEWKNDKRNGKGTLFFTDGERLEGTWKESKMHGEIIHIFPDGKKKVLNFVNGVQK